MNNNIKLVTFQSFEALQFGEKLLEDCAFIINRNVQSFSKKGRKIT